MLLTSIHKKVSAVCGSFSIVSAPNGTLTVTRRREVTFPESSPAECPEIMYRPLYQPHKCDKPDLPTNPQRKSSSGTQNLPNTSTQLPERRSPRFSSSSSISSSVSADYIKSKLPVVVIARGRTRRIGYKLTSRVIFAGYKLNSHAVYES